MTKTIITSFILFFAINVLHAQKKFTISGTIKKESTGETMIGVAVGVKELPTVGTSCNTYGFYSLTLPEGDYHLIYSFIGFETDTVFVQLNSNIKMDRVMVESSSQLEEIVISVNNK